MLLPPIGELRERKAAFLWALLSVVLLRLCWAPVEWGVLALVALVPFLWGLRGMSPRAAFWYGWVFGGIHFYTILTWLNSVARFGILAPGGFPLIYVGVVLMAFIMGLYVAVSSAGMVWFGRRLNPWGALGMSALLWAGLEWLRSAGSLGFPWGLLGYSVYTVEPLAALASLGGVPLISSFLLLINIEVMEAVAATRRRQWSLDVALRVAAAAGLLVAALAWGFGEPPQPASTMRVAVVQPNIPQDEKFASYSPEEGVERQMALQEEVTLTILDMLRDLEPGAYDLVVLPESAFPQPWFDIEIRESALQRELRAIATELDATLLVGSADNVFYDVDNQEVEDYRQAVQTGQELAHGYYNAAYFIRPGDSEFQGSAEYRKIHLVPFGETIPFADSFDALSNLLPIGGFQAGAPRQAAVYIDARGGAGESGEAEALPEPPKVPVHVAPTICFEDFFPYLHYRMSRRGAEVFVNITNDAWYDPTLGSRLHFAHARMRSVEVARPMIRCANTGVTAIVGADGEVLSELPLRERGVLSAEVPLMGPEVQTVATRFGSNWGILGFLLGLGGWIGLALAGKSRSKRLDPGPGTL
ncbi:MAG: apolipoprotein N-acyltransferase [Sumerlaeia bacterium]